MAPSAPWVYGDDTPGGESLADDLSQALGKGQAAWVLTEVPADAVVDPQRYRSFSFAQQLKSQGLLIRSAPVVPEDNGWKFRLGVTEILVKSATLQLEAMHGGTVRLYVVERPKVGGGRKRGGGGFQAP